MIVVIHVIIALLSMACASFGLVRPTNKNLRVSYGLVASTLASGLYLVWSQPASMLQACLSGVGYLVVVMALIAMSRRKLSLLQSEQL